MSLPAIIYLGFVVLGLGASMVQHGRPKEGNHNFWHAFIGGAIAVSILAWGGFFN